MSEEVVKVSYKLSSYSSGQGSLVPMSDLYKLLGINKDADVNAIKKAFRKQALKFDPDINQRPDAPEKFQEINNAYEILLDPIKRSQYDKRNTSFPSLPLINMKGAIHPF